MIQLMSTRRDHDVAIIAASGLFLCLIPCAGSAADADGAAASDLKSVTAGLRPVPSAYRSHGVVEAVKRSTIASQQFPPDQESSSKQSVAYELKKVLRKLSMQNQYTATQT